MQLEDVSCAICGGDRYKVVIASKRDPLQPVDLNLVFRSSADEPLMDQAVRCSDCGLVYVRPRLQGDLILEGYEDAADKQFISQVAFRERTFNRCLDRIENVVRPPGKRVLDVGTASGSFLSVAKVRGYEPFGCELSRWMCAFARDHYGLDLHRGTLFNAPFESGSIDLLTLWDVLEHTTDPKAVLQRANELLTTDGILALTIPDYGSLAARLLGKRWPFLLTVHLYYFEQETIRELLLRTGFKPLKLRAHLQTLEMGYVMKRAEPYLGPLGPFATKLVRCIGLSELPFHYWVGQTMVVAKKVTS